MSAERFTGKLFHLAATDKLEQYRRLHNPVRNSSESDDEWEEYQDMLLDDMEGVFSELLDLCKEVIRELQADSFSLSGVFCEMVELMHTRDGNGELILGRPCQQRLLETIIESQKEDEEDEEGGIGNTRMAVASV